MSKHTHTHTHMYTYIYIYGVGKTKRQNGKGPWNLCGTKRSSICSGMVLSKIGTTGNPIAVRIVCKMFEFRYRTVRRVDEISFLG